ncbi:MAG: GNAT family N-acetyltransferase [Pseudomonadota bacterium]
MPINYREATLDDLPTLLALEQCVVEAERPFNSAIKHGKPLYYDIEDLISSSNAYLVVAEHDGEIIATGYAQIRQSKQSLEHKFHSYLGFMYVVERWRGQGINQRVLGLLKTWSQKQGAKHLYLDVYVKNAAAIKAYEKAGFDPLMVEMTLRT